MFLDDGRSDRAHDGRSPRHDLRLSIRVGNACEKLLDERMRNLPCRAVEVDEIWCYVGKKQRHVKDHYESWMRGNFWTWVVAIDADTKIVPTHMVSKRDVASARIFIADLAERMANRIQISSDRLPAYVQAVADAFGENVDYGRIVKSYEAEPIGPGRYSPPKVVKVDRDVVFGDPRRKISTPYVEGQNLTMRMSMRRFTRLTNGFSKKLEGLEAVVALHFAHCNFVRKHSSLGTTPAVASGVEPRPWTMADLLERAL